MKLNILSMATLVLAATSVGAFAAEPVNSQVKTASPAQAASHPKVISAKVRHRDVVTVTGSHLKQDPRKASITASPLYVLDSEAIRNSGAVNVYELLTRRGFRR